MFAEKLFWFSLIAVFYVYFGYPLLLMVWRWDRKHPVRKTRATPMVTIIVAARNERLAIARKIENLLDLDYPHENLQIIVSLDGPTDGTEEIARHYEIQGVQVISARRHHGKPAALNRAIKQARGAIVMFADTRQLIHRSAIAELVSNFGDPAVGAVTGELVLVDETGAEASDGVGLYWRYEKTLRSMESDIHSTIGATGAIYAVRRSLLRPIPENTILDDVAIPMNVVLAGKRIVFEPGARAYDAVSSSPDVEFGRKVRTLAGNYQLLTQMPQLLLPRQNPIFIQFVSHKVGRLLAPYLLVTLFAANLFLPHGIYWVFLVLQSAWYLLACGGAVLTRTRYGRRRAHAVVTDNRRRA